MNVLQIHFEEENRVYVDICMSLYCEINTCQQGLCKVQDFYIQANVYKIEKPNYIDKCKSKY